MECSHKYVFKKNESFYRDNGRYSFLFTSIDYFFCENCLDEKIQKKEVTCGADRRDELPDWAKPIKNKV